RVQEQTQDRPAKELATRADLRGDREFTKPTLKLTHTATRAIEPTFKRQRQMIRKEDLGIAAFSPLVNENRHDGKLIVWLKQQVFRDLESLRILDKRSRVVDRSAEIACGSLSISDRKPVVAAFPFQTLMVYSNSKSIVCRNDSAGLRRAALCPDE